MLPSSPAPSRRWKWLLAGCLAAGWLAAEASELALVPDQTATEPGRYLLVWRATFANRYEVQQSSDLQTWTVVPGYPATALATMQHTPVVAEAQTRFYRVREVMIWCRRGTFTLGSRAGEPGHWPDEAPRTSVQVMGAFWLGKQEVTQQEYAALMGTNPSRYQGDPRRPVENVSWFEAVAYAAELTARERAAGRLPDGYEYRLPTEAQWEFACRAGTTTQYCFGDDVARLEDHAWFTRNSSGRAQPVGRKSPNPFGLFDMHGNAREWCHDWYDGAAYAAAPAVDPLGPDTGSGRVLRGGNWFNKGTYLRSAYRYDFPPTYRSSRFGFRVVRPA